MPAAQPVPEVTGDRLRPACPRCSTPMVLTHISPDKLGFDCRVFDCPKCGQQESKFFQNPLGASVSGLVFRSLLWQIQHKLHRLLAS
jgi:hypothetical protein